MVELLLHPYIIPNIIIRQHILPYLEFHELWLLISNDERSKWSLNYCSQLIVSNIEYHFENLFGTREWFKFKNEIIQCNAVITGTYIWNILWGTQCCEKDIVIFIPDFQSRIVNLEKCLHFIYLDYIGSDDVYDNDVRKFIKCYHHASSQMKISFAPVKTVDVIEFIKQTFDFDCRKIVYLPENNSVDFGSLTNLNNIMNRQTVFKWTHDVYSSIKLMNHYKKQWNFTFIMPDKNVLFEKFITDYKNQVFDNVLDIYDYIIQVNRIVTHGDHIDIFDDVYRKDSDVWRRYHNILYNDSCNALVLKEYDHICRFSNICIFCLCQKPHFCLFAERGNISVVYSTTPN